MTGLLYWHVGDLEASVFGACLRWNGFGGKRIGKHLSSRDDVRQSKNLEEIELLDANGLRPLGTRLQHGTVSDEGIDNSHIYGKISR